MTDEYAIEHRIGAKSRTRGADELVADLAGRQHGVVSPAAAAARSASGGARSNGALKERRLHPVAPRACTPSGIGC